MLAITGFGILALFMIAVLRKWASAFVAIIGIPLVVAALSGFGSGIPDMVLNGIKTTAPTAVLLLFAVFFFAVMLEARLFDPLSKILLRLSKGDPARLAAGTAVLALCVALDGDGTTSYMIICSAFLPIYRRLGLNPLIIATISAFALGLISGSTPWGGAATRGISVLHLDATSYFLPLIPALALTSVALVVFAYAVGLRARSKVDPLEIAALRAELSATDSRPAGLNKMWIFNAALTVALMICLVAGLAPLPVLFMIGFAIALIVNHPTPAGQRDFIKLHAASAMPVVVLVLAAGVFTGILQDTGMIKAMANSLLVAVPADAHGLLPVLTGLISIPLSFFMSNDAFFFGIVPVLAESAGSFGIPGEEIARAAVVGQMMHMIGPTSAPLWVLLGLVDRDLGEFQRYALLPCLFLSLVFLIFVVATGAISIGF